MPTSLRVRVNCTSSKKSLGVVQFCLMISAKRRGEIMGGAGSGNWYRFDKKTTTGECQSVDVRYLHREGLLEPGRWFSLRAGRGLRGRPAPLGESWRARSSRSG
jgi:hypothetical protein